MQITFSCADRVCEVSGAPVVHWGSGLPPHPTGRVTKLIRRPRVMANYWTTQQSDLAADIGSTPDAARDSSVVREDSAEWLV